MEGKDIKKVYGSKVVIIDSVKELVGESPMNTYRVVFKCQAGFVTTCDTLAKSAIDVFRSRKIKSTMSISLVRPSHTILMYGRTGKKVWLNEDLAVDLTVGDINQDLTKTDLFNQAQYELVNAKTWADKVFIENK